MIPTKLYVIASGGHELPPAPQQVQDLARRMRERSPNWYLRTDVPELDAQHLFQVCLQKYSLSGGLPVGFTTMWETARMVGHVVNPDRPQNWIDTSRESLRVEVHRGNAVSYVFLVPADPDLGEILTPFLEGPVLAES